METEISKLMTNIAALSGSPSDAEALARWKQIELIAANNVWEDVPDYPGEIVSPLPAVIYYSHFIAIVPNHKDAWRNVAIIARHEVGRLSVD